MASRAPSLFVRPRKKRPPDEPPPAPAATPPAATARWAGASASSHIHWDCSRCNGQGCLRRERPIGEDAIDKGRTSAALAFSSAGSSPATGRASSGIFIQYLRCLQQPAGHRPQEDGK